MTQSIRNRIIEFRRVPASLLKPNPRNWRTHPPNQRAALQGVLTEIGYAGALLARHLPDGSLELIDGHLRAETTPDAELPVLILDLDEREADLLLAVHDPLSAMAGEDADRTAALMTSIETDNRAVRRLLDNTLAEAERTRFRTPPQPEFTIGVSCQVVVHCRDEDEQRDLFEEMTGRGYRCRVLAM